MSYYIKWNRKLPFFKVNSIGSCMLFNCSDKYIWFRNSIIFKFSNKARTAGCQILGVLQLCQEHRAYFKTISWPYRGGQCFPWQPTSYFLSVLIFFCGVMQFCSLSLQMSDQDYQDYSSSWSIWLSHMNNNHKSFLTLAHYYILIMSPWSLLFGVMFKSL